MFSTDLYITLCFHVVMLRTIILLKLFNHKCRFKVHKLLFKDVSLKFTYNHVVISKGMGEKCVCVCVCGRGGRRWKYIEGVSYVRNGMIQYNVPCHSQLDYTLECDDY